ncbi:hypothetical protein C5L14_26145 [Labrys okinawensis]|uniref:Uncharacterized protein n=1 Tax=Labrys okinawensis TaxID=346911 RepID=A0A2S9Q5Q3_9HYPH|nr:hypothetical protein [Labrys okinawensis]PRH84667.1 hypothetical protein C5L14_26145 [Labrys okinawensis]
MSSVEFHEDEWGRHWSYSPALHGTQVRLHYSIAAAVVGGAMSFVETISAGLAQLRGQDQAAAKAGRPSDLYGDDDVPPVGYVRYEGVRDEFGRPLP